MLVGITVRKELNRIVRMGLRAQLAFLIMEVIWLLIVVDVKCPR